MAFPLRAPVPIRLERYINNIPIWSGGEQYNQGDVILRNNALYLAVIGSMNVDPISVTMRWRHIGEGGGTNGIISNLTVGITYPAGTFFYFENNLYVASAALTIVTSDTFTSIINTDNSHLTLVTFNPEFTGIETSILTDNYYTGLLIASHSIPGFPVAFSVAEVNEGVRVGTLLRFGTDEANDNPGTGPTREVTRIIHQGNRTIFVLADGDGTFQQGQRVYIAGGSNAAITRIEVDGPSKQLTKTLVDDVLTIGASVAETPTNIDPRLMTSGGIHNALPKVYVAAGASQELAGLEAPMAEAGNAVSYLLPTDVVVNTDAERTALSNIYLPSGPTDTGLRNDLSSDIGILQTVTFGTRGTRNTVIFTFKNLWVAPTPTGDTVHVSQVTEHADPINSVSFSARGSGYDEASDHLHISSQDYLDARYAPAGLDDVTGYRIEEGEVLGWMVGDTLREGVVTTEPIPGSVIVSGTDAQTFVFPVSHGFAIEDRFAIRLVHSADRWIYEVVSVDNNSVTASLRSAQPGAETPIINGTHDVEWAEVSIIDRGLVITNIDDTLIGTISIADGDSGSIRINVDDGEGGGFAAIPDGGVIVVNGVASVTGGSNARNFGDTASFITNPFVGFVRAIGDEVFYRVVTTEAFNAFEPGRGIAPFEIENQNATVSVQDVLLPEINDYPLAEELAQAATYTRGSVLIFDNKSWFYNDTANDLVIGTGTDINFRDVIDGTTEPVLGTTRAERLDAASPGTSTSWQELGALESNADDTSIVFRPNPINIGDVTVDESVRRVDDVTTPSFVNLGYDAATNALQISTHAALFERILLTQGFLLPRNTNSDTATREAYTGYLGTEPVTTARPTYWWEGSTNSWFATSDGTTPIVGF